MSKQFGRTIRSIQCNNGREFDNSSTRTFFLSYGVQLRMLYPYTSLQNGKVERMIRTTNDVMRSQLFQAYLPAHYWAESLYTGTYILNLLSTKVISAPTPYFTLFDTTPSYSHLRVFGCACYPNTSATAHHKLASRSRRCVFLGYSSDHKGYQCFDLTMNHVLISRHVVFDESSFPFASSGPLPDNLDSLFSHSPVVCSIAPPYPSSIAGTRSLSPCHTRPRCPSPRHVWPRRSSQCHTRHWRPRPRHTWPQHLHLHHEQPQLHASPSPPLVYQR
jgi:hypothetical protein